VVQENVLLACEDGYAEFMLTLCLGTQQYSKRPIYHEKFIQSHVESLMHEGMTITGRMQKAKGGKPSSCPRLNGEPQFIERKERGLLFVLCAKEVSSRENTYCKTFRYML
jgi:hypothetical protein